MKRQLNNRKGQVFIVSVVIAVTISLITSYALLTYMFKNPNPDQHLGSYQSGIIDSISDGDKILLYVDQAAKMAVADAWEEYAYGNPRPDYGGDIDDYTVPYCGSYVYRLWSTVDKDCYPDYRSESFELSTMINKYLAGYTYMDDFSNSDDEYKYYDEILKSKVTYDIAYYPYENHTTIKGFTSDEYNIFTFADEEHRENDDILKYIGTKTAFSGGEGDITGIPYIGVVQGNYLPKDTREIKYLVIHYTAGYDIAGAMSRFNTPGAHASSHYIIGRDRDDYTIVQPVMDKDVAYHAGCNNEKYGCTKEEYKSINTHSIGIEIVNTGNICDTVSSCKTNSKESLCTSTYPIKQTDLLSGSYVCWQRYPDEQYKKIVALSALIVKKYNIPIDREHIIGHVEIVMKNKIDPGPAMDLDKLVADINAAVSQDEAELVLQLVSADATECLQVENKDWEISDVQLSSTKLTSDQTLKISLNIANKGDGCVNINPHLTLRGRVKSDSGGKDIVIGEKFASINVHKSTDDAPYTTAEITCKFSSDENKYNKFNIGTAFKQPDNIECVLPVSNDGSEVRYTITGEDIAATDAFNHEEHYSEDIVFSVRQGLTDSYGASTTTSTSSADTAPIATPSIQLSNSEKLKFDKTKSSLESLGIMEYIKEEAADAGIPLAIILGLITQESGGDMHAGSVAGAYGLMQVMKSTFDGLKFDDKCTWVEYQNDAKCQIRSGIAALKQKDSGVKGATIYYTCGVNCRGTNSEGRDGYWSSCSGSCSATDCIGPTDKTYSGWEAALRRYNGGGDLSKPSSNKQTSGCVGWPDYDYVEKVLRFASAWGYVSTQDAIIKEELHAGIIGSYTIQPTFNVKLPLNFTIFDLLKTFVNETSKECGVDGINKEECIVRRIGNFNKALPKVYSDRGLHLSMSCDADLNAMTANKFVEEINDCVSSGDMNCQCDISPSNINLQGIESMDGYTRISYVSGDDIYESYLDYEIKKDDGSLLKIKKVSIDDINIFRGTDASSPLIFTDKGVRKCSISKNKYRLCLKTEYKYQVYDPNAKSDMIKYKDLILPFAITVRDNIAPKPVNGLTASNMAHAKDSIIVSWHKNDEVDITRYNLYLSEDVGDFSGETKYFKDNMDYVTIASTNNNYEEYEYIDFDNPVCEPQTTDEGIYCLFKYNARDKDTSKPDRDLQIELQKEKLYYINSQDKFVYIIDGTDPIYGLITDTARFLAVTAIDVDGNEIDNVKTQPDEKIMQGRNLISVTPHNLLEPALTKIEQYDLDQNFRLRLSWMEIGIYVDGIELEESVEYDIFALPGSCNPDQLSDVPDMTTMDSTSNLNTEIALTPPPEGTTIDYCVYVIPKSYDRKFMQGFALTITVQGTSSQSVIL